MSNNYVLRLANISRVYYISYLSSFYRLSYDFSFISVNAQSLPSCNRGIDESYY